MSGFSFVLNGERVSVADALPYEQVETWPGLTDMAKLQKLLWAAKQPMILLGGSRWSVPYYLDIGAGSSQLTWQWMLGALCAFLIGVAKTGAPGLGLLTVPLMVFAVGDARLSAAWTAPILIVDRKSTRLNSSHRT